LCQAKRCQACIVRQICRCPAPLVVILEYPACTANQLAVLGAVVLVVPEATQASSKSFLFGRFRVGKEYDLPSLRPAGRA
jgi:hypothetical protein